MARRPRFVLSIDGGGIRGVIPARVLAALEDRVGAPLHTRFDLVIGTSTGGIIAAGLTVPTASGKPKSASALEKLYTDNGAAIFPDTIYQKLRSLLSKFEWPLYDPAPLEKVIGSVVGRKASLKTALTRLVLTAYDIERRQAVFMSNVEPDEPDFLVADALRATSAAPTYFSPALVKSRDPEELLALIDGGVFANDPAMAGYVEVQKLRRKKVWSDGDTVVVSFGTGQANRAYPYNRAKNWGLLDWISPGEGTPIISILMQGQASTASYQLNSVLNGGDAKIDRKTHSTVLAGGGRWESLGYYRFDGPLVGEASDDLDDASSGNIKRLKNVADRIIDDNRAALDALAARLTPRED